MNLATGKPFADGEHILYVNGEYRGDSDIGKLMHDFNCTDACDMRFGLLADKTRYLKADPKGVSELCKILEGMRREEREESLRAGRLGSMRATARRMLAAGKYPFEEISAISGLSLEEVGALQKGSGQEA